MIIDDLKSIISTLTVSNNFDLLPETLFSDIQGWDSFLFIDFLIQCEISFNVKLPPDKIETIKSINDVLNIIDSELN